MMKVIKWLIRALIAYIVLTASNSWCDTILDSKHNLSVSGPGPIKSTSEEEVCIFCHTPHSARRDTPYLWNRKDTTASFTTYESTTMYANVGQPSGASKLCLSCHDGTIALGAVLSRPGEIPFSGGIRFIPEGLTKIGTVISDDHPVSFLYDESLAAMNGELISPSLLTGDVRLDNLGMVQCTSCHDPHNNANGKFIVKPNNYSALCISCHDRTDWPSCLHATSTATWNGSGSDPWPHTAFNNVDENACENCHRPHTAGGHARLLNYFIEEDNCLVCHNGNVASKNIESELVKPNRHPVQNFIGIHDAAEDFTSGLVSTHVECVDCHNPHRVDSSSATAPNVPGAMLGVKGITSAGTKIDQADNLYEVCFKCHADNNVTIFTDITRQNQQINTRFEFDVSNPSYHPVEGIGQNPNVPSLMSPYSISSIIYCTDCHNSDDSPANGGGGPNGPHGSINRYLLERNYTTTDNTQESSFEYAMCYKCHDRNSILNNASGFLHNQHVAGGGGMGGGGGGGMHGTNTPCSTCHDPHGVSSTQGNSVNNAHLINFNVNIVSPNNNGLLYFEDRGTFQGACYLMCHGRNHNPGVYPGGMGGGM